MKQRVVIAIALACMPELLIADEPTTALDVTIQAQILELMNNLKKELGTSLILITHDLGVVAEMCDKVAVIYAGEIVETGTAVHIFDETMHPYTEGLFGSLPNLTDKATRLKPIPCLLYTSRTWEHAAGSPRLKRYVTWRRSMRLGYSAIIAILPYQ